MHANFLNKAVVRHLGEFVKAQCVGQAVRIGVQLVAGSKLAAKKNIVMLSRMLTAYRLVTEMTTGDS